MIYRSRREAEGGGGNGGGGGDDKEEGGRVFEHGKWSLIRVPLDSRLLLLDVKQLQPHIYT